MKVLPVYGCGLQVKYQQCQANKMIYWLTNDARMIREWRENGARMMSWWRNDGAMMARWESFSHRRSFIAGDERLFRHLLPREMVYRPSFVCPSFVSPSFVCPSFVSHLFFLTLSDGWHWIDVDWRRWRESPCWLKALAKGFALLKALARVIALAWDVGERSRAVTLY